MTYGKVIVANGAIFKKAMAQNAIVVYVGRPTVLGNKWDWKTRRKDSKYRVSGRQEAIEKYSVWLKARIKARDTTIFPLMREFYRVIQNGVDLYLLCWCHPERCHADAIKFILERRLKRKERKGGNTEEG